MVKKGQKKSEKKPEGFEYKILDESRIELIPGNHSVQEVLEAVARVSYDLASPAGFGIFKAHSTQSSDVDFSKYVSKDGLRMDYVNGRKCKTNVVIEKGRLEFIAHLYEATRGSSEQFLDRVKSVLEGTIGAAELERQQKPNLPFWDHIEFAAMHYGLEVNSAKPRESRLKVALALDRDGKTIQAIEVMKGRSFDENGTDIALLFAYQNGTAGSAEKFYNGFADIDDPNLTIIGPR